MRTINWEQLYLKNATQLKGVCRRYVGDPMIAEDLVQETFITAIDKAHTFKGIGSVEGWIRKIAINKSLGFLREKQLDAVPLESISTQNLQETEMEKASNKIRETIDSVLFTSNELLTVIDRLPPHHKTVFNMYVLDGYTHKQIADVLKISIGTSKSCLSRARKKAQEMLYAEALHVQVELAPKRRKLWLLLLFRPHSIDSIFRNGLKGLELGVAAPGAAITTATVSTLKWGAVLTVKSAVVGFMVAAPAVGVVVHQMQQVPQAERAVQIVPIDSLATPDTMAIVVPNSVPVTTDTLLNTQQQKPVEAAKTIEKHPVVVKKTIVVYDTVRVEKLVSN